MRFCFLGAILLPAIIGCGGNPLDSVAEPEQLTLFSIDGRNADGGPHERGHGVPPPVGMFHDYPVLGSVEITDPGERQQIIAALKDGIARGGVTAACFLPRHGLRAVEKGKVVEYVICFECGQFHAFQDGQNAPGGNINSDIKKFLNQPLQNAGIPIAPE